MTTAVVADAFLSMTAFSVPAIGGVAFFFLCRSFMRRIARPISEDIKVCENWLAAFFHGQACCSLVCTLVGLGMTSKWFAGQLYISVTSDMKLEKYKGCRVTKEKGFS
eukprot:1157799-Pelagomonas_calceolata.AAC.12